MFITLAQSSFSSHHIHICYCACGIKDHIAAMCIIEEKNLSSRTGYTSSLLPNTQYKKFCLKVSVQKWCTKLLKLPIITPVAACNLCVCGMYEWDFFFASVIIEVTKLVAVIGGLFTVVQHFLCKPFNPRNCQLCH